MGPLRKTFIRATLTMVGMIIGAGIFGVPSVIADVGIVAGTILFWGTWCVVLATHLLFLELIALSDSSDKKKKEERRHRLPGYVSGALGSWLKYVTAGVQSFKLIGVSFAYLILGGEFLEMLFLGLGIHVDLVFLEVLFWILGAISILFALRIVSKIESVITWVLLAVLIVIIGSAGMRMDFSQLTFSNWNHAFAPIGIFLFSLFGMTSIPEIFEIAGRRIERSRYAVAVGSFVTALLTWLFGVSIVLAVPAGTPLDRTAMISILPHAIWWTLPLLGLFAVLTSFIINAFTLKMMYQLELKQPIWISRFIALGIPLFLLFILQRDFLKVLDVVGTFFTGGLAVLVTLSAYVVMHREKEAHPFWWRTIIPLFSAGFFIVIMLSRVVGEGTT